MSPQETCSATTRTYRQFLSNSGVCVGLGEGASYLPQFASKQARVLLDAEDRRRKVFSTSTVAFNRCTLGLRVSHPMTTSTPNSSMTTLTPRSPVFDFQLMVLCRRPSQHNRPMSIPPASSQSPLTKWSLRSECYLTRAVLLIHYRLQHSSPSSMFSRHF